MRVRLKQRWVAEGVGTAFLLAAVVGSGMMHLADGNIAIACGALCHEGLHYRSGRGSRPLPALLTRL
jgi:hypothetical protein